jgi:hypothetical protein
MDSLLFLGTTVVVLVLWSLQSSSKLHQALGKHADKTKLLPHAFSMLIISAQISELLKVIEHASVTNVVGAFFLLAIIAATRPGTQGELH